MQDLVWWKRAIVYEIYPRSFQDSDGDGVGDLNGILERLDYLVQLGVDAIWIAPIYPSPMADFGYDVADYCGIDPIFGNMRDFDRLLAEVHRRGLKMILDFVPSHTSDQHPWFVESRSSRTNSKRHWYLWRDEPNNWASNFGGSAWQWDEITSQYYCHSFLKEQPDLNWRNPAVKTAMFDVLRFWLARGVDGFRVDVMWLMIKDDQYRDNPLNPAYLPGAPSSHQFLPVYSSNRPEVHQIVAEMRGVIDEYPQRVLIGEIYLPVQDLMTYYGKDLRGANLPFNFQLLQTPWNAPAVAQVLFEYDTALPAGAWPNWVLGNHDNPRLATRIGTRYLPAAAMLLLTLPGTLTIYYGEEIGMTDVSISPGEVCDPAEKRQPNLGQGRDPERTPMPWSDAKQAGFTTGQPWLPLGSDYQTMNVAMQEKEKNSLLHLYRNLIALRRSHRTLISGRIWEISTEGNLLRYERIDDEDHFLILLNMGCDALQAKSKRGTIVTSTAFGRAGEQAGGAIELDAAEGLVVRLDG